MQIRGGTPIIQLILYLMSIARITFHSACVQVERQCVAIQTVVKGGGLEEARGATAGVPHMHSDGTWIHPQSVYRQ